MKNRDLYTLREGIQLCGNLTGAKLSYAMAKNLQVANAEIEYLETAITAFEASEGQQAYEVARLALCRDHAEKDENGDPVMKIVNGGEVFGIKDTEAFNAALTVLVEGEHADTVEAKRVVQAAHADLMEEDSDVRLRMVSAGDFPESVTLSQINSLMAMIEDDDESDESAGKPKATKAPTKPRKTSKKKTAKK